MAFKRHLSPIAGSTRHWRQIPTAWGGFIDPLCLDANGKLVIVELKRDKTPLVVSIDVPASPGHPSMSTTSAIVDVIPNGLTLDCQLEDDAQQIAVGAQELWKSHIRVSFAPSPGIAVCGSERREVEERFRKTSLPPSSGPHIKPEKAPDGNAESPRNPPGVL